MYSYLIRVSERKENKKSTHSSPPPLPEKQLGFHNQLWEHHGIPTLTPTISNEAGAFHQQTPLTEGSYQTPLSALPAALHAFPAR